MNIEIVDQKNQSSKIGVGALPKGSNVTIKSAIQITAWVESHSLSNGGKAFPGDPFKVVGGECMFDQGLLVCFAGAKAANQSMLVLRDFKLHPKTGDKGQGNLNAPPAAGVMTAGAIDWEITD